MGFSLFLVWTVFAWLSRRVGGCSLWGCSGISRLSTVWPLPVLSRAGRERAVPCWGWCGFRAWRCRGVGDDGMPRDCTRCGCSCGVSLYSSARCCSLGLRVCLSMRAWLCEWRVVVCACCAICFWWGVLLRSSRFARSAVCLSAVSCSHVAGLWRFMLFVGYCMVCVS